MDILIQASQFLLSLSILIVLHEAGHMIPAKLFKTRVEKFYLFFDPYFSIIKKKIGGTEYGIGWIPLGGYVKISGMIDESMDKEQMAKPAEPWEFRSKPAWQRLIIMLGGIIVNVIVAFVIYTMIMFSFGEEKLLNSSLKDGIWVSEDPLAQEIGLQTGDKIISIGDTEVKYFNIGQMMEQMLYEEDITIERNGEIKSLEIPENFVDELVSQKDPSPLFQVRLPFSVGKVTEGGIAEKAGLKKGDIILSVDDKPITYFDQMKPALGEKAGQEAMFQIKRKEEIFDLNISIGTDSTIGFLMAAPNEREMFRNNIYEFEVKKYSFLESIPAGFNKSIDVLNSYVKQFALILDFSSGAYKGVGSFISFGKMFPAQWDWKIFWERTAFISIILAFMNLLPIPALDGGHVMFLLYEIVSGKPPGEKFLEKAQMVGMFLLLGLMVFALGNDIFRNFF